MQEVGIMRGDRAGIRGIIVNRKGLTGIVNASDLPFVKNAYVTECMRQTGMLNAGRVRDVQLYRDLYVRLGTGVFQKKREIP